MSYEYSAKKLHNQLLYYRSLFDVDKARNRKEENEDIKVLADLNKNRFDLIGGRVEKYLGKCGRRWVSMENVFAFAMGTKQGD